MAEQPCKYTKKKSLNCTFETGEFYSMKTISQ